MRCLSIPTIPRPSPTTGRCYRPCCSGEPDGVLFDYVRYPRGVGGYSVVDRVDDLWIYGQASRDTFFSAGG
jgi:hypothetical protein